MDPPLGLLFVYGAGTAGFLLGRSRLKLGYQSIIVAAMAICSVGGYLVSPSLIHNHALRGLPDLLRTSIEFSTALGLIGMPCGTIGWIGGVCLRIWERGKKVSDASPQK